MHVEGVCVCDFYQEIVLGMFYAGIRRLHNFGLKGSKFLRHDDDNCMRAKASWNTSLAAEQENALDWVKHDKRRMLHVVYRVGDLDKSLRYVKD